MRRVLSLTLLACVALLGCGNAGAPSRTAAGRFAGLRREVP